MLRTVEREEVEEERRGCRTRRERFEDRLWTEGTGSGGVGA